jgi:hypothetical protein
MSVQPPPVRLLQLSSVEPLPLRLLALTSVEPLKVQPLPVQLAPLPPLSVPSVQ